MDMDSIRSFMSLGFGHITAPGALDHILFLLALAAIYRWNEWRQALVVVTAFTVGHSLTLALAVLRPGSLPDPGIVEFLIPLTIVVTSVENLFTRGLAERRIHSGRRAMLAGVFGLVHGAGFAGYLMQVFPGSVFTPLLGFNLGIELGQVVVLTVAFVLLLVLDRGFQVVIARHPWRIARNPITFGFRLRVGAVSLLVAAMASVWAVERLPW